MTRDQAQALLHRLGELLGIGQMELDRDSLAFLTIDDRLIMIGYDTPESRLVLMAPLGEPPAEPARLHRLLEANFLWRATGGASFAIDPSSGLLSLLRPLPAHLDVTDLQRTLLGLVDFADAWEAELAEGEGHGSGASSGLAHAAVLRA
jgi:hypothetical protein